MPHEYIELCRYNPLKSDTAIIANFTRLSDPHENQNVMNS
jgi:hypothetical protein